MNCVAQALLPVRFFWNLNRGRAIRRKSRYSCGTAALGCGFWFVLFAL